jgi:hypothetical protein
MGVWFTPSAVWPTHVSFITRSTLALGPNKSNVHEEEKEEEEEKKNWLELYPILLDPYLFLPLKIF